MFLHGYFRVCLVKENNFLKYFVFYFKMFELKIVKKTMKIENKINCVCVRV